VVSEQVENNTKKQQASMANADSIFVQPAIPKLNEHYDH